MRMYTFGATAAIIGLLSVLYGLILSIGIIPSGAILGITAGGALHGAEVFFLMAITFFLWKPHGTDISHHE